MKKAFFRKLPALLLGLTLASTTTSCLNDLDHDPPLNQYSTEETYRDPQNHKKVLARLYAALVIASQGGPTGDADISGFDGGTSPFVRTMWYLQELTTDEAVWTFPNDVNGAVGPLITNQITASNSLPRFMFVRAYFVIGLCNEFLRQTTDSKLSEYGISGADAENTRAYRLDARFLRALMYQYVVDMYGKGPFTTETDQVTYFLPKEASRAQLFAFVEGEYKAIEAQLPKTPEYGRAGQGAVHTALAHLYLNAQVYTGQDRYSDCVTYAAKVIDEDGYTLAPNYGNIFKADNNLTSASEIIFPLVCDGQRSQSYGNTTFLVHGSIVGRMDPRNYGVLEAWNALRIRRNVPLLFADSARLYAGPLADVRGNFFTNGQTLYMRTAADLLNLRRGLGVQKWSNALSTQTTPGAQASNNYFVDTDYPLMRLGEVYLTYAEAVLRGGGGDRGKALQYVNAVRTRANATSIGDTELDLNFIIDERGRETYWEGYRRTDLVRFGRYTSGSYLWPFKNNVPKGAAMDETRNLFPIPAADLVSNPNLTQNPGY